MKKRNFLKAAAGAVGALGAPAAATGAGKTLSAGQMEISWHNANGRLHVRLSARTRGWIAVGFNSKRDLKGTRFVIASVAGPLRAEEHIAQVPAHKEVTALGLAPALQDVQGQYKAPLSHLSFSLPETFPDQPNLALAPGAEVYLMLAWSHEPDFDHHSAWRQHFDVTL